MMRSRQLVVLFGIYALISAAATFSLPIPDPSRLSQRSSTSANDIKNDDSLCGQNLRGTRYKQTCREVTTAWKYVENGGTKELVKVDPWSVAQKGNEQCASWSFKRWQSEFVADAEFEAYFKPYLVVTDPYRLIAGDDTASTQCKTWMATNFGGSPESDRFVEIAVRPENMVYLAGNVNRMKANFFRYGPSTWNPSKTQSKITVKGCGDYLESNKNGAVGTADLLYQFFHRDPEAEAPAEEPPLASTPWGKKVKKYFEDAQNSCEVNIQNCGRSTDGGQCASSSPSAASLSPNQTVANSSAISMTVQQGSSQAPGSANVVTATASAKRVVSSAKISATARPTTQPSTIEQPPQLADGKANSQKFTPPSVSEPTRSASVSSPLKSASVTTPASKPASNPPTGAAMVAPSNSKPIAPLGAPSTASPLKSTPAIKPGVGPPSAAKPGTPQKSGASSPSASKPGASKQRIKIGPPNSHLG